jgi:hypothetical protein
MGMHCGERKYAGMGPLRANGLKIYICEVGAPKDYRGQRDIVAALHVVPS